MGFKHITTLISLTALLSGVVANDITVKIQGQSKMTIVQGEEVKLKCTTDSTISGCIFRSPKGESFFMYDGIILTDDGRLTSFVRNDHECGLLITSVKDEDNGKWECALSSVETGQSKTDQKMFDLTVAVPPTDVYLKIGDEQAIPEYQINMKDHQRGERVEVECMATQARPAPSFEWSIGDTSPLRAKVVDKVENLDAESGKADYVQILHYYPNKTHNHHELKCKVEHLAYSINQIETKENEADVILNILYPPQGKNEEFYELKVGEENTVQMKVYANPKPTKGVWKLGSQELFVGAQSPDKKFQSSQFEQGTMDGEWYVSLTIQNLNKNDTQVKYKLIIYNDEGEAEYGLKLALGADSRKQEGFATMVAKGETSSSMAIGVIVVIALIVLVVILIVVARSKGMLCFGGKKPKEEDTEHAVEKEGSDTESTEHQATKNTENKGDGGDVDADGDKQDDTKEDVEDQKTKKEKVSMATEVTDLFAAVRKSVKSKEKYEQSDSEVKLNDDKKDDNGEKDVDYAELDKNALNAGPKSNFNVEDEKKTVYEEIRPQ